ncbi:MAG: hypothetical protein M3Z10_10610 [Gemmatimonadota bacterium]|nr:hypothetical protein [Gemmatimonadota bacterium]
MRRHITKLVAAAGMIALAATAATAQQSVGGVVPSWQAWIGCWTTAPGVDATVAAPPLVCITPTADRSVVDVTTIVGQKVVSAQKIDASRREQSINAKGCTGTQQARWSGDGRRVYLTSTATCDGVRRTMTGIQAMTPSGDWLDIQGIVAGEGENVRVARYHDAGVPSFVPTEIASALSGRGVLSESARIAAGAAVRSSDVQEATAAVSAAVAEALLLERRQSFALDARELIRLADAGVPARVTDAMVAVSNPEVFNVAHRGMEGDTTQVVGQRIRVYMDPASPWDWGYSGRYGYNPYGYGYGYNSFGYSGGYGYYGQPVIIVGNPQVTAAHGRMVKGQGYKSDPSATPSRGSTGGSSASSPTASSSGSSSSASSAPAPAPAPAPATRTAQPKP